MTKMQVSTARSAALEVLREVEDCGAYANLSLQQVLSKGIAQADRALATELVYGVLKQRLLLDWHLQSFLSKPLTSLPEAVQQILRLGAYQLLFLDRVPARAAINEAVNQTKILGFSGLGGVVNGVLRNLERQKQDLQLPDANKDQAQYLSIIYSHPLWLVQRWLKRWGFAATAQLCQANNAPAPTVLRTNTLRIDRESLVEQLRMANGEVHPGHLAPESLHIANFAAVEKLEPFQAGLCTVQDESSMLVAHVLGAKRGEYVVDACAAPGGKTSHIAQLMQNEGTIIAVEIHAHKVPLINGTCRRLGLNCVEVINGDALHLSKIITKPADRVLVDAPCSGLGVLRRKSDARWRKAEGDIAELKRLQTAILNEAARLVKPGGTLVYSTCTVEPDENFEVIKEFRQSHRDFVPQDLNNLLPFRLERPEDIHMAAKGYVQLLPHIHGTDGFFIARLDRIV